MGGWVGSSFGVASSVPNRSFGIRNLSFGIRNLSFGIRIRCKNGDLFIMDSEELERSMSPVRREQRLDFAPFNTMRRERRLD